MLDYLTQVELACLHLQEPEDLPIITVALWFDERLKLSELKAWLADRMGPVARFSSRVAYDVFGQAYWKQESAFRFREHLQQRSIEEEQVWQTLGELHSQPLALDKPLWWAELLQTPRRSVAVFRVHHAVADGLALMSLLSTDEPDPAPVRNPSPSFWDTLKRVYRAIWGALSLLALPWDPSTALKGEIGVSKRLAMTDAWSVTEMKEVAHRVGGTINDLLVALLAGALRRHLGGTDSELKVVIPVALRTSSVKKMSNRFGLIYARLPMSLSSAGDRLREAKSRMDSLKRSGQALAVFLIFNTRGLTPGWFDRWFTRFFASKASTMMTNLKGPEQPIRIAGRRVEDFTFWASQVGHLALGVNVMSYRGRLRIGVASDALVMPDPNVFVAALEESWEELRT